MAKIKKGNTIVFLSTFPPRECGIATFTQDLSSAFDKRFNPITRSRVAAINETPSSFYNYPPRTIEQVAAAAPDDYRRLGERLNRRGDVKLINIQHEFGIFGGKWGHHLIPFLQVIKKPLVTTFHSVIPEPDSLLRRVVRLLGEKSKAVIVMNHLSKKVLESDYQIPSAKINFIPHGIPGTPYEPSDKYKEALGFRGRLVISTFGMLSPDKGIEYGIRALKSLVNQFPNLLYLVIGATHPVVRRRKGESYRNSLMKAVEELGLKNNVKFYNKYLHLEEIINYLKATDIYLYPLLNPKQSVSGTLSYALGCGRPAVATATAYAKHLVTPDLGFLVDFKKPQEIARALKTLIEDEKLRERMGREAYAATRQMTWPNVANQYFEVYSKIADLKAEERKLPEIKFDHLLRLTDNFGVFQHARFSQPIKRFGYTTDDNARALIAAVKYFALSQRTELLRLIKIYLGFLKFTQRDDGSFHNVVNVKKETDGSAIEDVQGRAIWALGFAAANDSLPQEIKKAARELYRKAVKGAAHLRAPRAIAFALTGLYHYEKSFRGKLDLVNLLARRELNYFRTTASPRWPWFENQFTYSNSKIPECLLYAYDLTKNPAYLKIAEKTLGFLSKITFEKNHYSPIGERGWYYQGGERAYFDQQPEDTASMVETKIAAYRITGRRRYLDEALTAFHWFLGKNHLRQMVYDEATGGSYDGLSEARLNLNQGAESTIAYLLSRLSLEEVI